MDEKEIIKKLMEMSDKEIIDYYKKMPMRKYNRLSFAYVKVHMLLDYIKVIEQNKSQLTSPANKVSAESGRLSPSSLLWGYIVLEICSFYEVVDKIIRSGIEGLPLLPDYRPELMSCRNQVIAHLDYKGNLLTTADWIGQFITVQKIGEEKIINDFNDYYTRCRKLFGSDI